VLAINGAAVTGLDDIARLLDHTWIGRPATITVLRAGRREELSLTPDERAPA